MTTNDRPGIVARGRPKLPDDMRCRPSTFKLDKAARNALQRLSLLWGIGLSATVRRVLTEAAQREK